MHAWTVWPLAGATKKLAKMLVPLMRTALLQQALAKSLLPFANAASHASFTTLPGGASKREASASVRDASSSSLLSALRRAQLPGQASVPSAHSFASSSEVVGTSENPNSWSKFRVFGYESKSSLGASMYAMIGTFGFSMYLNDLIYHPPRVVVMVGLMMILMYVRRP
jgi:hypothetical protein